ncbi:MAG TPA: FCD domain-containing protein [Sphingomonadaceae bacterium]|nr:FCD domain-containing protein [Sphingomonadaceae bacterium]
MKNTKGEIFQSVRGQSLSTRIVDQVIEALFAKKLLPGQFFGTEAQLAEMFQTSRVPIREALGRLEALGVVTIKTGAGGGATIAEGELDQFSIALAVQFMLVRVTAGELFDARIAIECRAAELAAEAASDEELVELRRTYDEISLGRKGRAAALRILGFHRSIVNASRSRTLMALMHALEYAMLSLYVEAWPREEGHVPHGYHALGRIMDRLEARDAEGAFQAMRTHLIARRKSVLDRLENEQASADVAEGGGQ